MLIFILPMFPGKKKKWKKISWQDSVSYFIQVGSFTYVFPLICQPPVLHAGRQPAMPLASGPGTMGTHRFTHLAQALQLTVDVPLLNPHSTGYRTLKRHQNQPLPVWNETVPWRWYSCHYYMLLVYSILFKIYLTAPTILIFHCIRKKKYYDKNIKLQLKSKFLRNTENKCIWGT